MNFVLNTIALQIRHLAGAIILAFVYVQLMPVVGFFVSTFLTFILVSLLLAPKDQLKCQIHLILTMALIISVDLYLIFLNVFNVPFAEGFLL